MFAILTFAVSFLASRINRTLSLIINTVIIAIVLILEGQAVYQFAHWIGYSTNYNQELVEVIDIPRVDIFNNKIKIKIKDSNNNTYDMSYYEISKYTNTSKDKSARLNSELVVYRNKLNQFICYSEYMKAKESRDNLKTNLINLIAVIIYVIQWIKYLNNSDIQRKPRNNKDNTEDDEIIILDDEDDEINLLEDEENDEDEIIF